MECVQLLLRVLPDGQACDVLSNAVQVLGSHGRIEHKMHPARHNEWHGFVDDVRQPVTALQFWRLALKGPAIKRRG